MAINKEILKTVAADEMLFLDDLLMTCKEEVYQISFQNKEHQSKDFFNVTLSLPIIGISYFWHPTKEGDLSLPPIWSEEIQFKSNDSIPILSFLNQNGDNRLSIGFSEIIEPLVMQVGVHEESKCLHISMKFSKKTVAGNHLKIYLNSQKKAFHQVIVNVRDWIFNVNKISCCQVPKAAWKPVYSTWYSFHQEVNEMDLYKEMTAFPKYNLATLILDDGWQTENCQRRYKFVGDWELAKRKFPEFASMIQSIHTQQQKILLWLSLPYVGKESESWALFKEQLLYIDDFQEAGILDVRFPDVREYLVKKVTTLFAEYDLDGAKLDFIDVFLNKNQEGFNDKWDIPDLESAVLFLLKTIRSQLQQYRKDLLIEFREDYFGPKMNEVANIFRVKDCPNNYIKNRVGIVRLRLLCPEAAVHSDMLMWHESESGEYAALQVLNCLYGVPQISVKLDSICDAHKKMLSFWLEYMGENADVLYKGDFYPENPHKNFDLISAENDTKKIITIYDCQKIVKLQADYRALDIVNATGDEKVTLYSPNVKALQVVTKNCYGEVVEKIKKVVPAGYIDFFVPKSGLVEIRRWGEGVGK